MINTRLWWHRTELPFELPFEGKERASVSIARDFYCDSTRMGQDERREGREEGDQIFVNRDGIYTSVAVEKDCVILRESEMPDCELPRSEEPNAYIGELDSGEMALLAAHAISAGEWLSVAPSDDDEEDDDDEDEGEEEEEEEEEGECEGEECQAGCCPPKEGEYCFVVGS